MLYPLNKEEQELVREYVPDADPTKLYTKDDKQALVNGARNKRNAAWKKTKSQNSSATIKELEKAGFTAGTPIFVRVWGDKGYVWVEGEISRITSDGHIACKGRPGTFNPCHIKHRQDNET